MRVPTLVPIIIFVLAAALQVQACSLDFQRTIDTALAAAKRENRLTILFFTASDWNERSIAMHKNVLQLKSFSDWLNPNFKLLQADFPQRFSLPQPTAQHNIALAEKYKVTELPTILAVTPDGTEVGRLEYKDQTLEGVMTVIREWQTSFQSSTPQDGVAAAPSAESDLANEP